jgi:hypothetical protein
MFGPRAAAAAVLVIALLTPATALAGGSAPPPPQVDSTLLAGDYDNQNDVVFTFTADDPADTFACDLDGVPIDPCDNPLELGDLPDGDYTLSVSSIDTDNTVGDPTVVSFTEDSTPPVAPVIDGPGAESNDTSPALTFTSEPGGDVQCSLDGAPFAPCTSPVSEPGLTDGPHELAVQQTDDATNAGDIGYYDWDVDTAPPDAPALSANVPALTFATSAVFHFSGEPDGTFQCALDGASFAPCTSPATYAHLSADYHELVVQQTDVAGNVSDPAIFDWQIEPTAAPTPPAAPATKPAAVTTTSTTPAPTPAVPFVHVPIVKSVHQPAKPAPAACVSRRTLTIHWQLPKGVTAGAPWVLVNGHVVARLKPGALAAKVSLAGRRQTVVHVVVRARTSDGVLLQTDRHYATCVAHNDAAPLHTVVLHVA